jgi:hypothetical protein
MQPWSAIGLLAVIKHSTQVSVGILSASLISVLSIAICVQAGCRSRCRTSRSAAVSVRNVRIWFGGRCSGAPLDRRATTIA